MKVGIQFFSVRNSMAKDPMGTLRELVKIGYKNWETCQQFFQDDLPYNYGLLLPEKEAKELISELGVTIIGTHLTTNQIDNREYLTTFLDYQAAIGCDSPGLAADYFPDLETIKRRGEVYNQVGQMCKDRGMRFHYHNHFQEFQKFGDDYVMDLILKHTDPELVLFELDTFWAMRGGADPIDLMERYQGRLIMLHQKDFPKDYDEPVNLFEKQFDPKAPLTREMCAGKTRPDSFVEIGTGIMDIQKIIDTANRFNVEYITLEQDQTKYDDLESTRISMANFRKYTGIDWE